MEDKGFVEKRKYVRFDVEVNIKFQVLGKNRELTPSEEVSAITKNLSVEGVRFICNQRLEPGTILKLEILLPGQTQPLHLEGQVKWSHSLKQPDGKEMYETGVMLFAIEKNDEAKFIGYVYDKISQQFG